MDFFFLIHFKYVVDKLPAHIIINLYRTKIILTNRNNGNKIIIKVHWNGKTDKYMTILNKTGKVELATYHASLSKCLIYIFQVFHYCKLEISRKKLRILVFLQKK